MRPAAREYCDNSSRKAAAVRREDGERATVAVEERLEGTFSFW